MKKLLKVFNSLEEIIAGSLFGVMCITILCQMFSRIFLKKALLFSEEISRFCYIWVVFLCISLGEKKFEHFNVEVFLSFVKEYQTSSSGHLQVCSALEFTFTCCTGLFSSLIFRKW